MYMRDNPKTLSRSGVFIYNTVVMCDIIINKCSIYFKHTVEDGCGGSYCKTAYEYVQKFGLETNASYPYNSYTHEVPPT